MKSIPFVGRNAELADLGRLLTKKTASLVVIKGRRRIGKSRLIEEFAHDKPFYSFSGLLAEADTTAQSQRDEFARQLGEQLSLPGLTATDWGDLFTLLARQTQTGRAIILLDEISWMGSKDSNFLGKLKIAWDTHFQKNPQLILILCGSISSWIEKNIISSTGFFGRISLKITLGELTLSECNTLLDAISFKGSALEKFMLLVITGGIPWYIELISRTLSAAENIKKLCFEPDGLLVDEFRHIFYDLFGRRRSIYRDIVEYLAKGNATYAEISEALGYATGGPLSEYLDELITSGFISRDFTWILTSNKESKLSRYRLSDNYLRFYMKCIAPRLHKIKKGQLREISLLSLPGWDSMMGYQFENIVLNNRSLVYQELGIKQEEIIFDNPFFQRATSKQKGCQIDYMIQTRLNNLYVCEIKFSKNEIKPSVIQEIENKISLLKRPKGFSCIPVLIYVDHIQKNLAENNYFGRLIDFGTLLTPSSVSKKSKK